MNADGKFWLGCWSLVAAVIAVIALCVAGFNTYQMIALGDMVAHGADPLRASCALDIGSNKGAICGALSVR